MHIENAYFYNVGQRWDWLTFEFGPNVGRSDNFISGCAFKENFHGVVNVENQRVSAGITFTHNVLFDYYFELIILEGVGGHVITHNTAISAQSKGMNDKIAEPEDASVWSRYTRTPNTINHNYLSGIYNFQFSPHILTI